jgi:hypothetical protein
MSHFNYSYKVIQVDIGQFAINEYAAFKDGSGNSATRTFMRDGLPRTLINPPERIGKRYIEWPQYTREEAQQVCDWLNESETSGRLRHAV